MQFVASRSWASIGQRRSRHSLLAARTRSWLETDFCCSHNHNNHNHINKNNNNDNNNSINNNNLKHGLARPAQQAKTQGRMGSRLRSTRRPWNSIVKSRREATRGAAEQEQEQEQEDEEEQEEQEQEQEEEEQRKKMEGK
ncbi:unnamed protein product [Polarella glacialis]|uniref:Uncharacterized protein n=1 Tax=Polarella glacialis TaxID=89957 RepID=A0A813HZH9_POLGL|nr:unnamed protein product [Polarella glacialis]